MQDYNKNVDLYINTLSQRLEKYFDIERNVILHNEAFDLTAYHRRDFFKSFITKSTVYEGYSVYEYILVRVVDDVDEKIFQHFKNTIKELTHSIVNPNKFHKTTKITGILIVKDKMKNSFAKEVLNFFYRKSYKFSFRGWSETQMAIVSLSDKKVFYPKHLKDFNNLLSF